MTGIFRGDHGFRLFSEGQWVTPSQFDLDALFRAADPAGYAREAASDSEAAGPPDLSRPLPPPVGSQEIWAAGVTYFRSRDARMEEAEQAGGEVFYDKVYDAERPELFLKATPARARGHLAPVCIRTDSTWDVPEPELTLAVNAAGHVFGYTIGNDMSSRSIEGENPLYLPQAKIYRGSCALGPGLFVGEPPGPETVIQLEIERGGAVAFSGETKVGQIKRSFDELARFLFRDNDFPDGALLMTGTGVVPESDFTLRSGDRVRITIDGLGTLENPVKTAGES